MKTKKELKSLTLTKRVISKFSVQKVEGGIRITTENPTCFHSLHLCITRRC